MCTVGNELLTCAENFYPMLLSGAIDEVRTAALGERCIGAEQDQSFRGAANTNQSAAYKTRDVNFHVEGKVVVEDVEIHTRRVSRQHADVAVDVVVRRPGSHHLRRCDKVLPTRQYGSLRSARDRNDLVAALDQNGSLLLKLRANGGDGEGMAQLWGRVVLPYRIETMSGCQTRRWIVNSVSFFPLSTDVHWCASLFVFVQPRKQTKLTQAHRPGLQLRKIATSFRSLGSVVPGLLGHDGLPGPGNSVRGISDTARNAHRAKLLPLWDSLSGLEFGEHDPPPDSWAISR